MKKHWAEKLVFGLFAVGLAFGPRAIGARYSRRLIHAVNYVSLRQPAQQLIIDAGHGGEDGGAVSIHGHKESEINLQIASKLDALLYFYGVDAMLLREDDRSLHSEGAVTLWEKKASDLRRRAALVEQTPDAVLISIHQNSYPDARYRGAQVFYADRARSYPFAVCVQKMLRLALDPDNDRAPAKIPDSVYLMSHTSCRAILVECGFLSNPDEEELLMNDVYQQKIAEALTAAYLSFCGEESIYES